MNSAIQGAIPPSLGRFTPTDGAHLPRDVQQVASQFEALVLGELLRHVREASSGSWLGEGGDEAGKTLMGAAEEELARAIASGGGLGLGRLIAESLRQEPPAASGAAPIKLGSND